MSVRPADSEDKSLRLEQFEELGEYAAAGQLATKNALLEAQRSMADGRIPIAGAVVIREADGRLTSVARGHNGRIPGVEDDYDDETPGSRGYPTDHGETGCLRSITNFRMVDWKRAVFATTLSPCVMCTRSIVHLHALGLSRVVIAESKSFPGRKDLLRALKNPSMQIVELTSSVAIRDMGLFARKYPWDWAADIGQIPPSHTAAELGRVLFDGVEHNPTSPAFKKLFDPVCDELDAVVVEAGAEGAAAAVVMLESGKRLALADDERLASGGNPVLSAPMRAMGLAGSAVNLRDCVLVYCTHGSNADVLGIDEFGLSSLGACELFRPFGILFYRRQPNATLAKALSAVGIRVATVVPT